MTEEESGAKVPSNDSTAAVDSSSQTRQRKKRKWDQPAESLVSAGLVAQGILSLGNISPVGIAYPGVAPVAGTLLTSSLAATCAAIHPVFQEPSVPQHPATVNPKLNQTKIQDEVIIAREIVINDAEPSVRYKLTKRQTQEEIQKCTGAVVITRGKYRPPNAPPDCEKPLYLHISAGAHLRETAERIIAVDRAAAMVDEMLKQSPNLQPCSSTFSTLSNGLKVTHALSTSVFLGFDADPSLNIAARIRGPNDQYINHIMHETGASVVLRGRGSGNLESLLGEEGHQPLHLLLSSSDPKGLEDAKRLAENLLDTISVECGASRISSCKVYSAVPPPHQLLAGVQSLGNDTMANASSVTNLTSSTLGLTPSSPIPSISFPGVSTVLSQGTLSQPGHLLSCGLSRPNMVGYPQPILTGGTSYNGYGGIYPQATPLQQVALALKQPPSSIASTSSPATSVASTSQESSVKSTSEKEKRPPQRRKFQELPIGSQCPAEQHQGSEFLKPSDQAAGLGVRNVATMPAPKKLVQPLSNGMPMRPPPRTMPPPPPPKFSSKRNTLKQNDNNIQTKTKSIAVPDPLVKLMEYGDEDDDTEELGEESHGSNSSGVSARKPFWAL